MWDDEVDVVCAGSGMAALAAAVSAADADLDVFVSGATAPGEPAGADGDRRSWFGHDIADPETSEYLTFIAEFSVGLFV